MSSILFFKRIFTNKIYWLTVLAAFFLLLCSIIYKDNLSGKTYMFISLFYDKDVQEALEFGRISMHNILLGYDRGYLWMFCPIIVGVCCVMTKKTERFVLFRMSKNKYIYTKYFSNLVAGGVILLTAYLLYMSVCMILVKENIWNMNLLRKLLSVFLWGVINTIPGIILSEFIENKWLILCIPFVVNYFMHIFAGQIIPYQIWKYISPYNYQIMFLNNGKMIISGIVISVCIVIMGEVFRKIMLERRCDCGQ